MKIFPNKAEGGDLLGRLLVLLIFIANFVVSPSVYIFESSLIFGRAVNVLHTSLFLLMVLEFLILLSTFLVFHILDRYNKIPKNFKYAALAGIYIFMLFIVPLAFLLI